MNSSTASQGSATVCRQTLPEATKIFIDMGTVNLPRLNAPSRENLFTSSILGFELNTRVYPRPFWTSRCSSSAQKAIFSFSLNKNLLF